MKTITEINLSNVDSNGDDRRTYVVHVFLYYALTGKAMNPMNPKRGNIVVFDI